MSAARKLLALAESRDVRDSRVSWPDPSWASRPEEFARDVLGKRTLARHQVEILDAYSRAGRIELVVCTGQKLGKTEDLIIAALLDWASVAKLNGFIMGPKLEWIDEGLWPRLVVDALNAFYPCSSCMPAHQAWCALVEVDPFDETPRPERCSKCSPLIPSELKDPAEPSKGRKSDWLDEKHSAGGLRDASKGRHLRGYTARKEGSKGGFSGAVRFYLDESSDISDVDRETVRGNMSGGGKMLAFGNLLYVTGWFYRAFGRDARQLRAWGKAATGETTFQMSSRLSPNCAGSIEWSDGVVTANDNAGRPVPGMATRDDIEANLRAWKGTNLILARVDAQAPSIIAGQLIPADRVTAAERRAPSNENGSGILQFGVDVARARDRFVIARRRGNAIQDIYAERLGEDDYARAVELVIEQGKAHRRPHERKPRLVYDASGLEGQKFRKELAAQRADEHFDIYPRYPGHPPRNRRLFDKRRDEDAYNFGEWLRTGTIPVDGELEAEIEATTAKRVEVSYGSSGQKWEVLRVASNDEMRATYGQSPDKRNACEYAVVDVDGSEAEEAPAEASTSSAPPASPSPPSRQDEDFVFVGSFDNGASLFDRQAMASAQLRGRA